MMRTTALLLVVAGAAILTPISTATGQPKRSDLTGKWDCDDNGIYHVRQIGVEVWWKGESKERDPANKKKYFSNIFHGTIKGNKIVGSWADDPAGEANSSGTLTLEIEGRGDTFKLKKTEETGGFGGNSWTPRR
jgi:hypothetical protein